MPQKPKNAKPPKSPEETELPAPDGDHLVPTTLDPNHPLARLRDPRQRAFVESFCRYGRISAASKKTKIDRARHYSWLRSDAVYREAWKWAEEVRRANIEDEIYRRGVEGWLEPVYHQGDRCGYVRKYSDSLLKLLAQAEMPDKYGQRRVQVTGPDGGPIQHAHLVAQLPPETVRKLAELIDRAPERDPDGTVYVDLTELDAIEPPPAEADPPESPAETEPQRDQPATA